MKTIRYVPALTAILICAGLALPGAALSAPQYTFINLGSLGAEAGVGYSEAIAINNAGQVTGTSGLYDSSGVYLGQRAFRWQNGTMTNLGCLPSCVTNGSVASAINAAGHVVGTSWSGVAEVDVGWRAFKSDGVTMTNLGTLGVNPGGGGKSQAYAINDAGQVVGYSWYFESGVHKGERAFLWQSGQMVDLGAPETGLDGEIYSGAFAINNAGQVLGTYQNQAGAWIPIVWDHGMMKPLAMYEVSAINNAGWVTGKSYHGAQGWRAEVYDGQSVIDLGVLGPDPNVATISNRAVALNDVGQVVGDADAFDVNGTYLGVRAFLWEDGTMIGLGTLGKDKDGVGWSHATDINEVGEVVGYSWAFNDAGEFQGERAFYWADGEHYNLNKLTDRPADMVLNRAVAINDEGWIIGNGEGPEGVFAYLLVPVPEPHQYLMLLAGLGLVGVAVHRRKQVEA